MPTTISDKVYAWCTSKDSVSNELAKDRSLSPGDAVKKLYGEGDGIHLSEKKALPHREPATQEELERAFQCGNFGPTRPSELFLRIFHDALLPLEHDPMMGCVSPSLMGSYGAIPLTIIAPLPDICRHMSNLIARAEKEVFLATNYWMDSDASRLITDALKELSKRAGARGEKAVVKILYDRGNPKQVIKNHQKVTVEEYTGKNIMMPSPDEAPHLDIQVENFHRPTFGTFHSKFMTVDRKYAVISSNNIQDNDNMEMMTHLEGPIVDSLYDVCLVSWHEALEPPMPSHSTPAAIGGLPTFDDPSFHAMFDQSGQLLVPDRGDARDVKEVVADGNSVRLALHAPADPHYDPSIAAEITRMQSVLSPNSGTKTRMELVTEHLNRATHQKREGTAPPCRPDEEMAPYIPHAVHEPFPIALVNRKPWGAPNHSCVNTPQNEAWLSALRNAKSNVFIQTPDLNAEPLIPAILEAVRRGIEVTYYVCLGYNDAGELLPFQGGTNDMIANKLYTELDAKDRVRLHVGYYVGKDQVMPIHNKFKTRSCHIKLMIVDDHIGIQGNGNQDTQSWFHSQETNIMIDSSAHCLAWKEGIRRNQNTHLYGMASQNDGLWRDGDGHEAPGAIGKDPGRFSWAKGVVGAVQRVRGAGGF
ncbi:hypothetical protein BLS_004335 [Venturia inaequalis]|uniref:PLD phosphodiesterase domain-containing protein n=1 Tax=Venturia inaequalis TaxID=5025 RepID=A0A8H3UJB3_VENIN|nr:hypothetical protein BLS_004335 [Venturia inaequalis]KAE9976628.1 hypothetical protein EG328_002526 [Venturia inaequalis]KAE9993612.1 hypothetical protein EG327_004133 [Venturia inaequalis]RDI82220.1 hypothetical protein Vi05172_g7780 [Venturia inaequalis]